MVPDPPDEARLPAQAQAGATTDQPIASAADAMRSSYVTTRAKVGTELLGGGEMNCIERAKLRRQEASGAVEDTVVDPQELDSGEDFLSPLHSSVPEREQRSRHLGAGQGAGDKRASPTQVTAEGGRLGSSTASLVIADESR